MIDNAIQTLLSQRAGLPAGQIHPSATIKPLTDQLPRLIHTLADDPPEYTDDGVMGVRTATYQLDFFADSLSAARTVQLKIAKRANDPDPTKRGLDGYKGTVDGTVIQRIWFTGNSNMPSTKLDGQTTALARCMCEMMVVYRETA